MYQRVVMNLVGGVNTRYETFEGKRYKVVPTVMLTEGVHDGSQGPLYYPGSEIGKNPSVWNYKPIVLYHPVLNGAGVSACDPDVLERQKVGLLFRSGYDGRLTTESWLDEAKLKVLDNRVLEAIEQGKTVEVSTGLYHDPEMTAGVWNGEPYNGVVHNILPDHLAILPDQVGACSVADGAGLLRNAGDELSFEQIRDQIRDLIRAKSKETSTGLMEDCEYCYVCDVYKSYAIYEKGNATYKVSYKVRNGKVQLEGLPETVTKVVSYVAASGSPLANEAGKHFNLPDITSVGKIITNVPPIEEPPMPTPPVTKNAIHQGANELVKESSNDTEQKPAGSGDSQVHGEEAKRTERKTRASALITKGAFGEEDRVWLETQPEADFVRVEKAVSKGFHQEIVPYSYEGVKDRSNIHQMMGNQGKPMTTEQYIAAAPPDIQEMLHNAMMAQEEEKGRLVGIITNADPALNAEWVKRQPMQQLRLMARLASRGSEKPVANYGGQAEVPMYLSSQPTQNQDAAHETFLPRPTFNWDKKEVAKVNGSR